jgi:hypothetical protein
MRADAFSLIIVPVMMSAQAARKLSSRISPLAHPSLFVLNRLAVNPSEHRAGANLFAVVLSFIDSNLHVRVI